MDIRLRNDISRNVLLEHNPKNAQTKIENKSVQNKSASVTTSGFFSPKNSCEPNFGGLTNKIINGVNKIPDKYFRSNTMFSFAKMSTSMAMMEAFTALVLAGILRPATIMCTKGSSKEEKQYAAVHGISSALIGYGFTVAFVGPVKKGAEKFIHKLKNDPNFLKGSYLKESAEKILKQGGASCADNLKVAAEYAPQIAIAPIRAALCIAMIPPFMKLLFPNHKKADKNSSSNNKVEMHQQDHIVKSGQINRAKNVQAASTFRSFVKEYENNAN